MRCIAIAPCPPASLSTRVRGHGFSALSESSMMIISGEGRRWGGGVCVSRRVAFGGALGDGRAEWNRCSIHMDLGEEISVPASRETRARRVPVCSCDVWRDSTRVVQCDRRSANRVHTIAVLCMQRGACVNHGFRVRMACSVQGAPHLHLCHAATRGAWPRAGTQYTPYINYYRHIGLLASGGPPGK